MKLVCPECKNDVALADYPDLKVGDVVECNFCGITLEVTKIDGENIKTEITEEGK
jgi:Zn ribbon nucleic-acid-binding protein